MALNSFPTATDQQASLFKGLSFDNLNNLTIIRDIGFSTSSLMKCVRDYIITDFVVNGQPEFGVSLGLKYTFEIAQTNVLSYTWDLGTEGGIKNTRSVVYEPKTMGKKRICANVTVFSGVKKSKCFEIYAHNSGLSVPNKTDFYEFSSEEEIVRGVNYGRLIYINGTTWGLPDVRAGGPQGNPLSTPCPVTFRLIFILFL